MYKTNEDMNKIAESVKSIPQDFSDWFGQQSSLVKSMIVFIALGLLVFGLYWLDMPAGEGLGSLFGKNITLPSLFGKNTSLPSLLGGKVINNSITIQDILCSNLYAFNQTNLTYGKITCAKMNISEYNCICYTGA